MGGKKVVVIIKGRHGDLRGDGKKLHLYCISINILAVLLCDSFAGSYYCGKLSK